MELVITTPTAQGSIYRPAENAFAESPAAEGRANWKEFPGSIEKEFAGSIAIGSQTRICVE